ncbi:MAG: ABC transporter ATP-binding protein [Pacificibacter sp.]|uniref:ABC transporter ATP-binding protein n=1 Tax=Pacificibacter sp. TaxID=1917866 RepID=UPI00321ACD4C
MLQLTNLTKSFGRNGTRHTILNSATLDIPKACSLAVLGRNGAGKTSLLKIISGKMAPDSGAVQVAGKVSWPVGFSGSFHGALTGVQNTVFVARVYGIDTDDLVNFVRDFTELGQNFNMPVRTYSSGMKARLAFAISMGIPFDTYIVDEVTSVGDAAFRRKSSAVMRDRLKRSGAIIVSHNMKMIRELCDCAVVLEHGELTYFPNVADAITVHEFNMDAARDQVEAGRK